MLKSRKSAKKQDGKRKNEENTQDFCWDWRHKGKTTDGRAELPSGSVKIQARGSLRRPAVRKQKKAV